VRWLWLQKIEPHHPWSALSNQVPDQVRAFFLIDMTSEVGNGEHTFFWTNQWLHEKSIAEIAPLLFAAVPQRMRQKWTVREALLGHAWTTDIQGALNMGIIVDYIQVWDHLLEVQLQPEVEDIHKWRLAASGQYSAKSSYESLFLGATSFEPCE
jgi:hypothetical protein